MLLESSSIVTSEQSFDLSEIEFTFSELDDRAQQHDVMWLKQQFAHYVEGYMPDSNQN